MSSTLVFSKIEELGPILLKARKEGKTIGFVPTMGALHEGHIYLVKKAQQRCDLTVMSIFVNPTQFNDKNDLLKYPRTLEADTKLVDEVGLNYLYAPNVEEIYPKDLDTSLSLDLGHFDKVLEGTFRPGHFAGVCQVVKRLLDLVKPDQLLMGQKDFQQFTIVGRMIDILKIPTELVVIKTRRNKNGLALSSRNARLSDHGREHALFIYKSMLSIKRNLLLKPIEALSQNGCQRLTKKGFNVEYVAIVSGHTLLPVVHVEKEDYIVVCVAAWYEGVRLIDNLIIKDERMVKNLVR
jgi:pantoate--beta-alanine ligase